MEVNNNKLEFWLIKLSLLADAIQAAAENTFSYGGTENLKKMTQVNYYITCAVLSWLTYSYDEETERLIQHAWSSLTKTEGVKIL